MPTSVCVWGGEEGVEQQPMVGYSCIISLKTRVTEDAAAGGQKRMVDGINDLRFATDKRRITPKPVGSGVCPTLTGC